MDDQGIRMGLSLHFQVKSGNAYKRFILLRSFFLRLWDKLVDLLIILAAALLYLIIWILFWL